MPSIQFHFYKMMVKECSIIQCTIINTISNSTNETSVSLERIIILKHEYKDEISPKEISISIFSQPKITRLTIH